jgi:hypothetical protein
MYARHNIKFAVPSNGTPHLHAQTHPCPSASIRGTSLSISAPSHPCNPRHPRLSRFSSRQKSVVSVQSVVRQPSFPFLPSEKNNFAPKLATNRVHYSAPTTSNRVQTEFCRVRTEFCRVSTESCRVRFESDLHLSRCHPGSSAIHSSIVSLNARFDRVRLETKTRFGIKSH